MPTQTGKIEELEGRRYRCRHLACGDTCGLAGQEDERPTMAQEGFDGERPMCRLAHTVAKGTTNCNSCHIRCATVIRNVRHALLAADPAQRDEAVKVALRTACCGWEPRALAVSNRLPGGAP